MTDAATMTAVLDKIPDRASLMKMMLLEITPLIATGKIKGEAGKTIGDLVAIGMMVPELKDVVEHHTQYHAEGADDGDGVEAVVAGDGTIPTEALLTLGTSLDQIAELVVGRRTHLVTAGISETVADMMTAHLYAVLVARVSGG